MLTALCALPCSTHTDGLIAKIEYKGPASTDPLSFRHYNADEIILGKTMKEWCRFAVCWWHTFRGVGGDPFGPAGTIERPWEDGTDSVENAKRRCRVAFEFFQKLGVGYYTFHDVDLAPEGKTLAESNTNLDACTEELERLQKETGIKLLWGTQNVRCEEEITCCVVLNVFLTLCFWSLAANVVRASLPPGPPIAFCHDMTSTRSSFPTPASCAAPRPTQMPISLHTRQPRQRR